MNVVAFLMLALTTGLSCDSARRAAVTDEGIDHPFVRHVLGYPGFEWRTVTTDHFTVHGVADSYPGDHLAFLAQLAEQAREHVLRQIGEDGGEAQPRAHVFLVRGADDFRALVGQPAGGWTEPDANAVLAAASDLSRPQLRHELGHLFSHRLWGPPHGTWISEGVAVFAVGHCAGISLHQWAAAIQRAGEPVSIDLLERDFDFTRAAPHLLAASFVMFVVERHGIDAVRTLWRNGLDSAQQTLGMNGLALEAEWHASLRDLVVPQAVPDFRGRVNCENVGGQGLGFAFLTVEEP